MADNATAWLNSVYGSVVWVMCWNLLMMILYTPRYLVVVSIRRLGSNQAFIRALLMVSCTHGCFSPKCTQTMPLQRLFIFLPVSPRLRTSTAPCLPIIPPCGPIPEKPRPLPEIPPALLYEPHRPPAKHRRELRWTGLRVSEPFLERGVF